MSSYQMSVDTRVLIDLKLQGIEPKEAVIFFGTQVKNMMVVKPNYGPQKNSKMRTYRFPTWILKGYYPNTTTLFRITLIKDDKKDVSDTIFYAKVTLPPIRIGRGTAGALRYNGDAIDKYLSGTAEHEIFGVEKPEGVDMVKLNIPKCISPRGMPVFSLNKGGKGVT